MVAPISPYRFPFLMDFHRAVEDLERGNLNHCDKVRVGYNRLRYLQKLDPTEPSYKVACDSVDMKLQGSLSFLKDRDKCLPPCPIPFNSIDGWNDLIRGKNFRYISSLVQSVCDHLDSYSLYNEWVYGEARTHESVLNLVREGVSALPYSFQLSFHLTPQRNGTLYGEWGQKIVPEDKIHIEE